MGQVIRAGRLFRDLAELRREARSALLRSGEAPLVDAVDWLILSAWAVLPSEIVRAVMRARRRRLTP